MRTCSIFIVICAAFSGWAQAQSPVEIVDGRESAPWVDLSAWMTRPPIQRAGEAARAYWRAKDPNYEEDVHVLGVAEGAFTRPDAEQQAVLFVMSLWPRCCPKMGLAIVEGDRLVRNAAFEGNAGELSAAPDLDGDGRDELFYVGSFGMGGQESRTLTFLRVEEDRLVEQGSTSIYDSSCAAGGGDSESRAARILALPGPAFMVERYVQASCEEQTWELAGEMEPLDLDPSSDLPYVDLAVPETGH